MQRIVENPNLHSDIFAIIWLILIVALMIIGIGAYNKNKKNNAKKKHSYSGNASKTADESTQKDKRSG